MHTVFLSDIELNVPSFRQGFPILYDSKHAPGVELYQSFSESGRYKEEIPDLSFHYDVIAIYCRNMLKGRQRKPTLCRLRLFISRRQYSIYHLAPVSFSSKSVMLLILKRIIIKIQLANI